jgi:hypothetical protein
MAHSEISGANGRQERGSNPGFVHLLDVASHRHTFAQLWASTNFGEEMLIDTRLVVPNLVRCERVTDNVDRSPHSAPKARV